MRTSAVAFWWWCAASKKMLNMHLSPAKFVVVHLLNVVVYARCVTTWACSQCSCVLLFFRGECGVSWAADSMGHRK